MFEMFKSKLEGLGESFGRYNDKEAAEGIVSLMVGVAQSDGVLDPSESAKLEDSLSKNPVLKQFDAAVLKRKAGQIKDSYAYDREEGEAAVLKELREVDPSGRDQEKRLTVFRAGRIAARADGEFGPQERDFLRKAAEALRLDPALADA